MAFYRQLTDNITEILDDDSELYVRYTPYSKLEPLKIEGVVTTNSGRLVLVLDDVGGVLVLNNDGTSVHSNLRIFRRCPEPRTVIAIAPFEKTHLGLLPNNTTTTNPFSLPAGWLFQTYLNHVEAEEIACKLRLSYPTHDFRVVTFIDCPHDLIEE